MLLRIARWRLAVFAVTVSLALLLGVLRETTDDRLVWNLATLVPLLLALVLVVSSLTLSNRRQQSWLEARPAVPELSTPANPVLILVAAGQTLLLTGYVTNLLLDPGRDAVMLILAVLGIAAGVLVWTVAIGGFGVRLRPSGIVDRQPFGSLFIPWEALAADRPIDGWTTRDVTLSVTHPDLVRRTGLRRGGPIRLPAASVRPELLALAVTDYATRPDRRSLIGLEPYQAS
ncbi:hypothetical protein AB0M02_39230 [Actinoplanes sp. NPDC051861]|uniref:hypothetical protein n=1 Tax=Actinoplanes sp. NPDC051861 TaxID=3155170 RepID=UPI003422C418